MKKKNSAPDIRRNLEGTSEKYEPKMKTQVIERSTKQTRKEKKNGLETQPFNQINYEMKGNM